ncbi:AdipoR-hemolysin-III-related [Babesia duncani]|nr:AdipoR-hemolysin-III-related [Babesia duncani]
MEYDDFYRRIDYAFILLMIGGSALPAAIAIVKDTTGLLLLLLQWIGVSVGAVGTLSFGLLICNRVVRVAVYFSMTINYIYMGMLLFFCQLYKGAICTMLSLLLYALGGLAYAFQMPNLFPQIFGYHELFHLFCVFGLVFTFVSNHEIIKVCKNGL